MLSGVNRLLVGLLVLSLIGGSLSGCTGSSESSDPSSLDGTGPGEDLSTEADAQAEEDQRLADWENQEGDDWDAFDAAYTAGFDVGCENLFADSPNGSLYEDDDEYTVSDCQNYNPGDGSSASDVPVDLPDDPEAAGTEVGELDGCQALFENDGVTSLNYGDDSVTEDDCPVSGSAGSSYGSSGSTSQAKPSKVGGAGTYVTCSPGIQARTPQTSCPFAQNVFYTFWLKGREDRLNAYSPTAGRSFAISCDTSDSTNVVCTTAEGAAVKLAKSALQAYSQSQADQYAATHKTAP